jgi:hypothetical protein
MSFHSTDLVSFFFFFLFGLVLGGEQRRRCWAVRCGDRRGAAPRTWAAVA